MLVRHVEQEEVVIEAAAVVVVILPLYYTGSTGITFTTTYCDPPPPPPLILCSRGEVQQLPSNAFCGRLSEETHLATRGSFLQPKGAFRYARIKL